MTDRLPHASDVESEALQNALNWLRSCADEMAFDLRRLVESESPSMNTEALDGCLSEIESIVTRVLGPATRVELYGDDEYGSIMVREYFDTGSPETVVLLAHYDTVWRLGTLQERPWSVELGHARAPGGFDMKAGLVQGIWAVAAAREAGMAMPRVRLVITPDEEVESPFSRPHVERLTDDASAVLVLESSAAGALKTARSGVGRFTVEVRGVSAHAGLDPEEGCSAIEELAHLIPVILKEGNHLLGTTLNFGRVDGGTRPNVVAERAVAELDVRVKSTAEAERIEGRLLSLSAKDERAQIRVTGDWSRPVMERTTGVADLFDLARSLGARLGQRIEEASVGGASDGNFVAHRGIPVLDGLGAVGGGAHAANEWVDLDEMPFRAALVSGILAAFGASSMGHAQSAHERRARDAGSHRAKTGVRGAWDEEQDQHHTEGKSNE